MKTILDALKETLNTLREMSPQDYAALDDDTWELTQDIKECCTEIADRVMTLEVLAPFPVKDIDAPLKEMHGVTCYATQDALTQGNTKGSSEDRIRDTMEGIISGIMEEQAWPIKAC